MTMRGRRGIYKCGGGEGEAREGGSRDFQRQ